MRTMASSCLQPQEIFPAFYCSSKGVFFPLTSTIPTYPTPGTSCLPALPGPHPHIPAPCRPPFPDQPRNAALIPEVLGGEEGALLTGQ